MRNFTAYIEEETGFQRRLDLLARDPAHAITSANYLIAEGETLLHIVEQGDW